MTFPGPLTICECTRRCTIARKSVKNTTGRHTRNFVCRPRMQRKGYKWGSRVNTSEQAKSRMLRYPQTSVTGRRRSNESALRAYGAHWSGLSTFEAPATRDWPPWLTMCTAKWSLLIWSCSSPHLPPLLPPTSSLFPPNMYTRIYTLNLRNCTHYQPHPFPQVPLDRYEVVWRDEIHTGDEHFTFRAATSITLARLRWKCLPSWRMLGSGKEDCIISRATRSSGH
jgi:hypothetical protein